MSKKIWLIEAMSEPEGHWSAKYAVDTVEEAAESVKLHEDEDKACNVTGYSYRWREVTLYTRIV